MDSSQSLISHEDIHTLPAYAQTILPELSDRDLPILILTSHSHTPPLRPSPDLKFDVRNLPNPPKHVRHNYNGTSKRLREWIREDSVFVARRDAIRIEIEAEMSSRMDAWEKEGAELPSAQIRDLLENPTSVGRVASRSDEVDQAIGNEGDEEDYDDGYDDDIDTHESGVEEIDSIECRSLKVGIFCHMGRHRSVAMVEELARQCWSGWQVKVEHRDIFKKRGEDKKAGRERKSRGKRGAVSQSNGDCG